MTTTEAAEALGVTRQTVTRWIREGNLPARAIPSGDRVICRIRRAVLVEWVRRHIQELG